MKTKNDDLPHTFQNLVPGLEKIQHYLTGGPACCIKECDDCSNNKLKQKASSFNNKNNKDFFQKPYGMCFWETESQMGNTS